jgi:predicted RNA-binding Zn-ribbon protein involved in translation (DUF1610 family)
MELAGFTDNALEQLMAQVYMPDDNVELEENTTKHECPKCGYSW